MNGYELPPGAPGLVAALAVGLVIGLERGWHDRELPEGGRVAGLRTFALTGLLGGAWTSAARFPALAFAGCAADSPCC
jgi:hypothetical protein